MKEGGKFGSFFTAEENRVPQPFWLMTLASHAPGRDALDGYVHAHLLVGNIPYDLIRRELDRWPFRVSIAISRRAGGPWGIIHYVCSQVEPLFPGSYLGAIWVEHRIETTAAVVSILIG